MDGKIKGKEETVGRKVAEDKGTAGRTTGRTAGRKMEGSEGRGGKKEEKGRKDENQDIHISKSLSKLLRHQALKENLTIDSQGFVPVAELLQHRFLKSNRATLADIQRVVENDAKNRYTMKMEDGQYYICANQGHSISSVKSDLVPLTRLDQFPTTQVVHGTSKRNYELIKESGYLSKMNRNHIHFAIGLPRDDQVISGMRQSASVYLFLDVLKLLQDGYKFYQSLNKVILSEGIEGRIPLDYFKVEFRLSNGN